MNNHSVASPIEMPSWYCRWRKSHITQQKLEFWLNTKIKAKVLVAEAKTSGCKAKKALGFKAKAKNFGLNAKALHQ